ncbi:hypothetical protein D3C81_2111810 [compost metagenome]
MATRWMKITLMAFSSTVNAKELKNSMVSSSSQPITPRLLRKCATSATMAFDCPGTSHSR